MSYRAEVPVRRIGPDGDADGSWGITRGRVTMPRPNIGTVRLSVLRSRYSPPVRPEGRLRPARALFANCGRISELIGSKTVWCVAQGPYPTHRGPSRPVGRIWSERHYRTVARTDHLKSGRPPHSALSVGILKFNFPLNPRRWIGPHVAPRRPHLTLGSKTRSGPVRPNVRWGGDFGHFYPPTRVKR
jgi:hypothetical protein